MHSIAQRTHTCGALRPADAGKTAILHGWVDSVRDKGGVMFLILRDRHGTVQVTLDERCGEAAWAAAKTARLEYVLEVHGTVHNRAEATVNTKMETGSIEVVADQVHVLSSTKPLPFTITDDTTTTWAKSDSKTVVPSSALDVLAHIAEKSIPSRASR